MSLVELFGRVVNFLNFNPESFKEAYMVIFPNIYEVYEIREICKRYFIDGVSCVRSTKQPNSVLTVYFENNSRKDYILSGWNILEEEL